MVSHAFRLAVLLCAIATSPLLAQQTASQLANLRHWSGQGVAPVYEGFDINPDGSMNMWFGYMNRNYEEEIDIPVGPANTFEPGGDRGQERADGNTCGTGRRGHETADERDRRSDEQRPGALSQEQVRGPVPAFRSASLDELALA